MRQLALFVVVMVYNIHAGRDAAGVDNLERVAELINTTRPDLVLLQEVDRGTTRSGNVDQLAELMRRTRLHGVFGKSLDYQGGEYGIATLSRWPIDDHQIIPLRIDPPQPRAGGSLEPRIALIVKTNGMRVLNTHLDASRVDTWRLQEITRLLAAIDHAPILAGGDFNSTPDSTVQQNVRASGLRDAWTECGRGDELTFPADKPVKRIDYLFLPRGFRCASASVLNTTASDHRPVVVNGVAENDPPAPASAQITAFAGLQTGGTIELEDENTGMDSSPTFGVMASFDRGPGKKLDLLLSHQDTRAERQDPFEPLLSADVSLEYFQIGGRYSWDPERRLAPYVAATIGGTHIRVEERDGVFFSFAIGVGAEMALSPRFAWQIDGRLYTTLIGDGLEFACTDSGQSCSGMASGSQFYQFAATTGVVIRF